MIALLMLAPMLWANAIPPAQAVEVEFKSRTVRRDILALYDSRYETVPSYTRIHHMAEMPLNWLGYKLTYQDVNAALPPAAALADYRAIVSWLVEPLGNAPAYARWLDEATGAGLRLIALGDVVPSLASAIDPAALRVYERIGLRPVDQFVSVTNTSATVTLDRDMIGFERPLDKALPPFPVLLPVSSATRVHLGLSVSGETGNAPSAVVATSPGGGYVAEGYTIFYEEVSDRVRWTLNPFLFFKLALGEEQLFPIPDVTTLDGRRIYFSHIDGDGWNNISEIENYRETQTIAGEVVRQELIEPYPDLPVSAGLIAGDAMPELGGTKAAQMSARALYKLPQVEVASHTYTHPFAWGFFENYDRAKELELVDKVSRPSPALTDRMRAFLYRVAGKDEASGADGRYIAGSSDLPRSYLKEPFDIDKEINVGLRTSEALAPPGKKVTLYQWSGDTEPFEAAVRATRQAGVRNINGGDTRLDDEFPSTFYVPPISRPVGRERQIYAGNSNENTYTNNWHGPYYGQAMLKETLRNTDAPRRLKPFNIYYHMYSGEKPGSLAALKGLLDQARAADVIPVKTSEYAAIADDFFAVAFNEVATGMWHVTNRGQMQTFRFDDAAQSDVDWVNSNGVIGANRLNGALYVALDPAVPEATIALRARAATPMLPDRGAYLIDSRWQIRNVGKPAGSDCGLAMTAQGYGTGDMSWQSAPGMAYAIVAEQGGQRAYQGQAIADASGKLTVKIAANAIEPVQVTFHCFGGEPP